MISTAKNFSINVINGIENITSNQQEEHTGECPEPETTWMGFIFILELESEMSSVSQSPYALLIFSEEKRLRAIHLALLREHSSCEGLILSLTVKGAQSNSGVGIELLVEEAPKKSPHHVRTTWEGSLTKQQALKLIIFEVNRF